MKYIIACMFAFAVGATAFAQNNNSLNGTSNGDQNDQNMPATSADDDAGDNFARENPGSLGDTGVAPTNDPNKYDDYTTAGSATKKANQGVSSSVNNTIDTTKYSIKAPAKGNSFNGDKSTTTTTTTTKEKVGKNGPKKTTTKTVTKTLYNQKNSQ